MTACRALVALVAAVAVQAASGLQQRQSVTPLEKVISLLKKLQGQVQEEGRDEAVQYDKFACFCKEQADQKKNAVAKSEEKIEVLKAEIEKLDAEITDLNADIKTLGEDITTLESDIKTDKEDRDKEREVYVVDEKDLADAISAVTGAIEALRNSKEQMTGAKTSLGLVQLHSAADKVLAALSKSATAVSNAQMAAVMAMAGKASEPGKPAGYQYQSNDIIATLMDLQVTFKKDKKELDEEEFGKQTAHEKRVLGMENEKEFKEREKTEKEETVASKTEQQRESQSEEEAEQGAMDADKEFNGVLATECEDKAKAWDQRSQTRAAEMTALAEAVNTLEAGVKPVEGANKKLVGLASTKSALGGHWEYVEDKAAGKKALSFIQLRNAGGQAEVVQRSLRALDEAASRLQSTALTSLAMKVENGKDNFVKVRTLIKDLIARLEQNALDEADSKSFCDKEMSLALKKRDDGNLDMEEQTSTISEKQGEIKVLIEEIATLSKEIAEHNKALNEATELRTSEKAGNEKTLEGAAAGKEAVEYALSVLEGFYGLIQQQKATFVPKDSDRYGKTVGDMAPKTFSNDDYKGKQAAAKGILGILEVIRDDFERTTTTVTKAEEDAVTAFEKFETETTKAVEDKKGEKTEKEGKISDAEVAVTSAKDSLVDAEKLRDTGLEELSKLESMCVAAAETYNERKEKRFAEIAALKQALQILEDWKN